MAEMKNICGKIPLELHAKVRQEIEQREISTQQFIQQVIEEHFTEKGGQVSMAVRTVAVQVSEELFARFKAAVAKKGCKQKDFLIALIERAIEEIEAESKEEKAAAALEKGTAAEALPAQQETEPEETETEETNEPVEVESGETDEPVEVESGETDGSTEEESEEPEAPEEQNKIEAGEPTGSENEEASGQETAAAFEPEQDPNDTAEVA